MKTLLVLVSYHHHNTGKIAHVFAHVLDAPIKTPQQVKPEELEAYSLWGLAQGYTVENTMPICLTLPITCPGSPIGTHLFFQPVPSPVKPKSPKITQP
jgi:hypothetical protein